ncbi:hypothetical protein ABE073_00460 [Lederbergia citrisecunda]|uniref:hypothetical protein n=1 Tax=Lederbergia citrisecunda TaxID=2833583 RepID=UPI003D2E7922
MSVKYLNKDECISKYISHADMPNACPMCKHTIIPEVYLVAYLNYVEGVGYSEAVFKCVNNKCGSFFIGKYADYSGFTVLYETVPKRLDSIEMVKSIQEISPDFSNIYNQATQSEGMGLDQICGIGYRKALEFLIKDYIIYSKRDTVNPEKVKSTWLGQCIKKYTDEPRIKSMIEKAIWLGNDEAHYIRHWENKDVNDLKALINLTLHFIQMEIEYKKYEAEFTK